MMMQSGYKQDISITDGNSDTQSDHNDKKNQKPQKEAGGFQITHHFNEEKSSQEENSDKASIKIIEMDDEYDMFSGASKITQNL